MKSILDLFSFEKNTPSFCGMTIGTYDDWDLTEDKINERRLEDGEINKTLEFFNVSVNCSYHETEVVSLMYVTFELKDRVISINDFKDFFARLKAQFEYKGVTENYREYECYITGELCVECECTMYNDLFEVMVEMHTNSSGHLTVSIIPQKEDIDIYRQSIQETENSEN